MSVTEPHILFADVHSVLYSFAKVMVLNLYSCHNLGK